jgi:GNAT superfamily N-acetyltransferase
MELREISAELHAEQVLPISAPMWAGRRDEATYVRQTLEIARSAYGKKFYRLFGFYDGDTLGASFKRYHRTIRVGNATLRAYGIGAVFTAPDYRGRGYASAMLAMALDRWRSEGYDVGFLYSDIRPQFYGALGFELLPSRLITLRADALPGTRVSIDRLNPRDWPAVARCFAARDNERPWAFERNASTWNWLRLRGEHGSEHTAGDEANMVVRRGRELAAYVLGVRSPKHDAYILDEFGYAKPDDATLVAPLLRGAAGDLRRITGWLPPDGARELLPRGAVRKRKDAMLMAAPLTSRGRRWIKLAAEESTADPVWSTDHV